jgi:uncharacterized membrane protein
MSEPSLTQLTQAIITIFTTVSALFGANYLLDWFRYRKSRPVIAINPDENPFVVQEIIDIPVYDFRSEGVTSVQDDVGFFYLHYKVNRIKVRNKGNTAAEDCKGLIIQNGKEMKICWNVPSERHKMTINVIY